MSGDATEQYDRDELAAFVAEECDRLADKWWSDRESYFWSLENDPFWEEPNRWIGKSQPPVRACGRVLARILTEYDPGEKVPIVELLEWTYGRSKSANEKGYGRIHHGYYRAGKAIREGAGFGWPESDPVLGEVS